MTARYFLEEAVQTTLNQPVAVILPQGGLIWGNAFESVPSWFSDASDLSTDGTQR